MTGLWGTDGTHVRMLLDLEEAALLSSSISMASNFFLGIESIDNARYKDNAEGFFSEKQGTRYKVGEEGQTTVLFGSNLKVK